MLLRHVNDAVSLVGCSYEFLLSPMIPSRKRYFARKERPARLFWIATIG